MTAACAARDRSEPGDVRRARFTRAALPGCLWSRSFARGPLAWRTLILIAALTIFPVRHVLNEENAPGQPTGCGGRSIIVAGARAYGFRPRASGFMRGRPTGCRSRQPSRRGAPIFRVDSL